MKVYARVVALLALVALLVVFVTTPPAAAVLPPAAPGLPYTTPTPVPSDPDALQPDSRGEASDVGPHPVRR